VLAIGTLVRAQGRARAVTEGGATRMGLQIEVLEPANPRQAARTDAD
jgi:hypothetical protein